MRGVAVANSYAFRYLGSTDQRKVEGGRCEEESADRVEWVKRSLKSDWRQKATSKRERKAIRREQKGTNKRKRKAKQWQQKDTNKSKREVIQWGQKATNNSKKKATQEDHDEGTGGGAAGDLVGVAKFRSDRNGPAEE